MKNILLMILFILSCDLIAQTRQNQFEYFERNNIKATEIEPNPKEPSDIYKIEYPWGKTAVYNYTELQPQPTIDALGNVINIDTTYIDLTTIDTSLYANMFTHWKEVDIGWPIYYGDENKNGQIEFYGQERNIDSSKFVIYEKDSSNNFYLKHTFKDYIYRLWGVGGLYDLKNLGQKNYFLLGTKIIGGMGINGCLSYKNDNEIKLPTTLDFIIDKYSSFDNLTFGDFDKNGRQDLLFVSSQGICIAEYEPIINNIEPVYSYKPDIGNTHGFATGDFDLDGKIEIVASSIHGYISLIKNTGIHNYEYAWQARVQTYNLLEQFVTNDFNNNGKPEFWVAGFNLEYGYGYLLKLFAFESVNDSSYIPVKIIILKPNQSNFIWVAACFSRDIDNDGIEEIIITTNSSILILKLNSSENGNEYSMFFFSESNSYQLIQDAQFTNVDGETGDELLVSIYKPAKNITKIYKKNFSTGIYDDYRNNVKNLGVMKLNVYPNPFNHKVKLSFNINDQEIKEGASLDIFNILGQKIKSITMSNLSHGENIIEWDGKDDYGYSQSSGVYLINLRTMSSSVFNKTVLIK